MNELLLLEYRCSCNHLLFKGVVSPGSNLEIKCKNCGQIISYGGKPAAQNNHESSHFIFLIGEQGQILDTSISGSQITGFSVDEIKKRTIFDFIYNGNQNLSDWINLLGKLSKTPDKFFISDTTFLAKNGEALRLRAKFKKHNIKNKLCVVVFYELINPEKKPKEITLHTPKAVLLNLIIEIGLDAEILYISDELLPILGHTKKVDILGLKLCDFLSQEFSKNLSKDFKSVVNFKISLFFSEIVFKNREEKFDIIITPIYYPDNNVKGFKIILKPSSLLSEN